MASFVTKRPLLIAAVAAISTAASLYFLGGQFAIEKAIQALIAPVGLIWLALFVQTCWLFRCRWKRPAVCTLVLWIFLTLAGNQLVIRGLIWTLESQFVQFQFQELKPLPMIVVLGGSTGTTLAGDPQGGDRVLMAARLWHSGKVQRIITSGSQFIKTSVLDLHPGEEAKLLLIQAGVPSECISVNYGLNTISEFASLRETIGGTSTQSSIVIGVVTSASHLQRALQLAENEGFQPIAIPASFSTLPFQPGPDLIIPSAGNLSTFQACLHENLGWLLGR